MLVSLLILTETGQELSCKHSKEGMPANSTKRLPHAERHRRATIQVIQKANCIGRMLSDSLLFSPQGEPSKGIYSIQLKQQRSRSRLGLSGPSLTVAAAPHITAGTRPKWVRASVGSRPKWAHACIFSNLSQFCFSNSLQGGGRDARKAIAARALNNARARGTRNSCNFWVRAKHATFVEG